MSIESGQPEFTLEDFSLTSEENEDLEEADDSVGQVRYSGQDFDVDGLVRRLNNGDIVVPGFGTEDTEIETAGFQRGFVWNRKQMDRFIESLLLGFPIPGIFLVRQQSDQRYLILDGQQRLTTMKAFYRGVYKGQEFALSNVSKRFRGLTYETLSPEQRRTVDNAFIQATVVSTDGTAESLESVYQIFERLNSGGTQLTPHEIRVALYAGPLINELDRLNSLKPWRDLYGAKSARLRDQELVLRILALSIDLDRYSRPLKSFLNEFAGSNRSYESAEVEAAAGRFETAALVLERNVGRRALRKSSQQVNAAQAEAVMVGLMDRLRRPLLDEQQVSAAFDALITDEKFSQATSRSTADELVVEARLEAAKRAFADLA